MFLIVQLPLADLRGLSGRPPSRLRDPDWMSVDPPGGFLRGFGPVRGRNQPSLGLGGERFHADFNRAVRFRGDAVYRQPDWPQPLPITPWFRRFYFDGALCGRFEFGFVIDDVLEGRVLRGGGSAVDPRAVAATLCTLPVSVRAPGLPDGPLPIHRAGTALATAYLAATTPNAALPSNPPGDAAGRLVTVGPPLVHARFTWARVPEVGRDGCAVAGPGLGVTLTQWRDPSPGGAVVVQRSASGALDEPAAERAVRVVFAHLNAMVFALTQCRARTGEGGLSREALRPTLRAAVARLRDFVPSGPGDGTDRDFAEALRTFGRAHEGRLAQLTAQLETLADSLDKPTTLERVLGFLQGLLELALTTGVKTVVETQAKKAGA